MDDDDIVWTEILTRGGPFHHWKKSLMAALIKEGLLGYVIHDLSWNAPVHPPDEADYETVPAAENAEAATDGHSAGWMEAYRNWRMCDIQAFGIILARLDPSIMPSFHEAMSAKDLYDTIDLLHNPYRHSRPYDTLRTATGLKLDARNPNVLEYCAKFQTWVQNYETATDQFIRASRANDKDKLRKDFTLPEGIIKVYFVAGLKHIEWLRPWRHHNRPEDTTLNEMMTSLKREYRST